MTCLRRCTCHTDRRNSRRCSRSRRNSTTCRSYRYHSRRRSRRYSRRHSSSRRSRRSIRRRSRRKSRHSYSRSRGCTRRSPTCNRRCMHRHSWSRRHPNSGTCTHRCEQEGHTRQHTPFSDGQERGEVGADRLQTDQLPEQPDASCRRARPPSTSPVIAESCVESGDESCALSSGASIQPLDVESIIARWTNIAYCGPCIC